MTRTCFSTVSTFVSHDVALPQCCPVSRNPFPGSTLRVSYIPKGIVMPVEDLAAMVAEYVGGHQSRRVRNMEEMVQDVALRAADTVRVPVRVVALLIIRPPYGGDFQKMRVSARAGGRTE